MIREIESYCMSRFFPTLVKVSQTVSLACIRFPEGGILLIGPVCAHPPSEEENLEAAELLKIQKGRPEVSQVLASDLADALSAISYLLSGRVYPVDQIYRLNPLFADMYVSPALGILSNQAHAVYLAEPIADVLAVTFTVILFRIQFRKAMNKLATDEAGGSALPLSGGKQA